MADLKSHKVIITAVDRVNAAIALTIDDIAYNLSMPDAQLSQFDIVTLVQKYASVTLDALNQQIIAANEDFTPILNIDIGTINPLPPPPVIAQADQATLVLQR